MLAWETVATVLTRCRSIYLFEVIKASFFNHHSSVAGNTADEIVGAFHLEKITRKLNKGLIEGGAKMAEPTNRLE